MTRTFVAMLFAGLYLSACTSPPQSAAPSMSVWDAVTPRPVDGATHALDHECDDNPTCRPIATGVYWGIPTGLSDAGSLADGGFVDFQLHQFLRDEACDAYVASTAMDEECLNDYIVREGRAILRVRVDTFTVAEPGGPGKNFYVDFSTAHALMRGAPVKNAPDGFTYVPFPFLLTVKDGVAVRADQYWVP